MVLALLQKYIRKETLTIDLCKARENIIQITER